MSTASRFNSGVAILSIQPVQSLDLPELKIYLTLRRVVEHERQGVLVAANIKTIRRLLASRFTVLSVLLTPAWLEKLEPQLRARPEGINVYVAEPPLLETITGYQLHQGALAVAKIPPPPSLETLLQTRRARCCSLPWRASPAWKTLEPWCGTAPPLALIS